MKALELTVLRPYYDCTNGGASSNHRTVLVPCLDGYVDVDENNPPENLMQLVKGRYGSRTYCYMEPYAKVKPGYYGWMAGGNYAASADTRWSAMTDDLCGAVAIHDRQECAAEYLSND